MSMLRSLAWPHLVPTRSSEALQDIPASNSVKDRVSLIENQKTHTRRSSHGDQPRTPPYRALPIRPNLHARASDPALPIIPTLSSRVSSPTYVGPESILRRYTILPVQIKEDHRAGSDVSEVDPPPQVILAIGTPSDHTMSVRMPGGPPLKVLRPQPFEDPFEDELLQALPDTPIGGQKATPAQGSEKHKNRTQGTEGPRFEVVSPSHGESEEASSISDSSAPSGLLEPSGHVVSPSSQMPGFWSKAPHEALKSSRTRRPKRNKKSHARTKGPRTAVISGSSQGSPTSTMSDSKALMDPASDYFGPFVNRSRPGLTNDPSIYMTAQQTPVPLAQTKTAEQNGYSYDGPRLPKSLRPSVLDFAQAQSAPSILGPPCCEPPTKARKSSPKIPNGFENVKNGFGNVPNGFENVPNGFATPSSQRAADSVHDDLPGGFSPTPPEEFPQNVVESLPLAPGGLPEVPAGSGLPGTAVSETPEVAVVAVPELPQKKKVSPVKQVIRNGRRIVLRPTVLCVVLGRQLAKPTAIALKQISKGLPIEAVADAAGDAPVPASVPF